MFVRPIFGRTPEEAARRVTLAQTAIFEDVDFLAGGVADVTAHEAANGPAHARIGETEVQEMLLGLVGCKKHRPVLAERVITSRLGAEKPLEGVDVGAGKTPFRIVVPGEFLFHGRRDAPTVGESKLGEHRSGSGEAEVFNEVLTQEPHSHRVDKEGALPGETDHAPLWIELQQLLVMQILHTHRPPHQIERTVVHFD